MNYDYIAVLVFAAISVFVPMSLLLTAKLLRHKTNGNAVKGSPYESAEATIGRNRDVINEYLPFFMMFLPFELVAVLLLVWSSALRQASFANGTLAMGLAVMALAFAFAGYFMIRGGDGRKR